ncbi:hypothetical protein DL767_006300 [Monosporascus sp. MG133]|nr:hypothetical protein DL767_006300 [Monosporascus sp. MG133]
MSSSTNIDTPSEAEQASPGSSMFPVLASYYVELLAALKSLMDTVARNKYCDAADVKEIKEIFGFFAERHYLPRGMLRRLDDVLGVLLSAIPANAAKWNAEVEKLPELAQQYDSLRYNAHLAYMEPWRESITVVAPLLDLARDTYGHLKQFESLSAAPGYEPQAEWFYGRWKHHEATFTKLRAEIGLFAEVMTFNDCRETLGLPRLKR